MAELSQKDQLALHEFSVRYRAEYARKNPTSQKSLDTVSEAVRDQYEQEMEAKRSPSVEPPEPTQERDPIRADKFNEVAHWSAT
jgi:hypothetical protein